MKRSQVIIAIGIGTFTAIAIGYFGVQYLGRNTMYGISAGIFGLGVGGFIGQQLTSRKQQRQTVKIREKVKVKG